MLTGTANFHNFNFDPGSHMRHMRRASPLPSPHINHLSCRLVIKALAIGETKKGKSTIPTLGTRLKDIDASEVLAIGELEPKEVELVKEAFQPGGALEDRLPGVEDVGWVT